MTIEGRVPGSRPGQTAVDEVHLRPNYGAALRRLLAMRHGCGIDEVSPMPNDAHLAVNGSLYSPFRTFLIQKRGTGRLVVKLLIIPVNCTSHEPWRNILDREAEGFVELR